MKVMRVLGVFFVVLSLVVTFMSCQGADSQENETTSLLTENTTTSIGATTTTVSPTSTITTTQTNALTTRYQFDPNATVEDAISEVLTDPYNSQVCYYHIPKISTNTNVADKLNQQMLEDGNKILNESHQYVEDDVSIVTIGYNYVWGKKDHVISVLAAEYDWDIYYHAYNLSLETGEILNNNELAKLYGFSEQELTDLLTTTAGNEINTMYEHIINQFGNSLGDHYDRTVSEENIKNAQLFINQNGDLCSVITIYTLEGGGSVQYLFNLTGNSEPEIPNVTP